MAKQRHGHGKATASKKTLSGTLGEPPAPFHTAPAVLGSFCDQLDPRHCYVIHVDSGPAAFKRKIFTVPVLINTLVVVLMVARIVYIGPYYWQLFETTLGTPNTETLVASDLSWRQLIETVLRRGLTFMLDLCLAVFLWPWPVEFLYGGQHGSPVGWRWNIGFRDDEIYVRRSRGWVEEAAAGQKNTKKVDSKKKSRKEERPDLVTDAEARRLLLQHVTAATSPQLLGQKTGYLLMDGDWDLDWDLMVWATALVDRKEVPLEAFRTLALLHHEEYGWLYIDLAKAKRTGTNYGEWSNEVTDVPDDERRRQVFAFRDALEAIGKDELFYRWIEIIQFEASQPGGLGDPERQAAVAVQVRELFAKNGVDFDQLWQDTVGTEGLAGMS